MTAGFVIAVFTAAYALIIIGKFKRSIVAFSAGMLLVFAKVFSDYDFERLGELIDFNTLGLLIGMMVIAGVLGGTGFFQYFSIKVIRLSGGRTRLLLCALLLSVGVFSALLDKVTTIILFAPILFLVADTLGKSPVSIMFASIMAANIGGTATLIGAPSNILIGSAAGLGFVDFVVATGPIALIALVIFAFYADKRIYQSLADVKTELKELPGMDPSKAIHSKKDLKICLSVFVAVLIGFSLHGVLGYEPSVIALGGAAAVLLLTGKNFSELASDIEWDTLLFFIGLFLLSSALNVVGIADVLSRGLSALAAYEGLFYILLLWITAGLAAIFGAVPTVAVLIPIMRTVTMNYGIPVDIWWAVSIGACFGGGATITGEATNMVGLGLMEKYMKTTVTYFEFLKFSLVPTLMLLTAATVYIALRFAF